MAQNEKLEGSDGALDDLPRFELAMDASSLAGLAAQQKRTLNVPDARTHPSYSRGSSAKFRYEVRSMLVVPLVEPDGDVLGVLQLMNARDESGAPCAFGERSADLCEVLASHAATALVMANLHAEQQRVFDSLVGYTAAAIDARDPCTAGHSSRVALYAVKIAREIGTFTEAELRELRFAGFFHDVGKIGVRECVLTKAAKVTPENLELIAMRFAAACEAALARAGADPDARREGEEEVAQLKSDLEFIARVSDPGALSDADAERLQLVARRSWRDHAGAERALLKPDEIEKLSVRRGSLTDAERREIQAHAQLSWEFLKKLPFPKDLERVPELAWSHHERMDGSGYPRGLKGDEILPAARILTVADVFDALTAEDRPYKKAISAQRAMQIIEHEAGAGAYEREVVDVLARLLRDGKLLVRPGRSDMSDVEDFDASLHAWP